MNLLKWVRMVAMLSIPAAIFLNSCGDTQTQNSGSSDTLTNLTDATANVETADPDTTDAIPASGYTPGSFRDEAVSVARHALQSLLKDDIDKQIINDISRHFTTYEYDLNDDGKKEIFVGLTGPYFCGSGGCTLYLLDSKGKLITRFTVVDGSVSILESKSEGWRDLVMNSGGNEHKISFKGNNYPSNPSIQPLSESNAAVVKIFDYDHQHYPRFDF